MLADGDSVRVDGALDDGGQTIGNPGNVDGLRDNHEGVCVRVRACLPWCAPRSTGT